MTERGYENLSKAQEEAKELYAPVRFQFLHFYLDLFELFIANAPINPFFAHVRNIPRSDPEAKTSR